MSRDYYGNRFQDIKETCQMTKTVELAKMPTEQFLIDSCKHCVDAYAMWIECDVTGEVEEHYNVICSFCPRKEKREVEECRD